MNSYCTITIDGKSVGLKFGMPAQRHIAERNKSINLFEDPNADPVVLSDVGYATVLHAGYLNNLIVKETTGDLTFEHFCDYVENAITSKDSEELSIALSTYSQSNVVKTGVEVKKKVTRKQTTKRKR